MRRIVLMLLGAATLGVAALLLVRLADDDRPVAAASLALSAVRPGTTNPPSGTRSASALFAHGSFEPLPPGVELDGRKVALGDRLFHDAQLSADGTTSCASCHDLRRVGIDNCVSDAVVQRLRADDAYGSSFADVYSGGITPDNIRDAIANFERSLAAPGSRSDR